MVARLSGSDRCLPFKQPVAGGGYSRFPPIADLQTETTSVAARRDRDADLDRDLGAVATALHYDAGVPADQAITRARETFRPGETVRAWWERATAGKKPGVTKPTG